MVEQAKPFAKADKAKKGLGVLCALSVLAARLVNTVFLGNNTHRLLFDLN
jgi:hypothetical protein